MTAPGAEMVRALRAVHSYLREDIATLELALAVLADPERARELLDSLHVGRNAWSLRVHCERYCNLLGGHHSLEDQRMFPTLVRAFPELRPVIDRLAAEHVEVDELIGAVRAAARTLDGTPDTAERAHQAIATLAKHLGEHLAYEEDSLNPYLLRLERDWH